MSRTTITRDLIYFATAAALGAGWFVVLHIPQGTGDFLHEDPMVNAVCLVLASVSTAFMFRRYVASAESFGQNLLRAVIIPYAGCLVFLTLLAAVYWTPSVLGHGLMNVHDTMSLYLMGMMAAIFSCFVVVPYGLFCQYCLRAVVNR